VLEAYGGVVMQRRTAVGEVTGLGRIRPDGKKIVELRKRHGLTQEALAEEVSISVRVLRDIERKNHAVRSTTITAIATALKADPDEITLSVSERQELKQRQELKLRAVRSANEFSRMAREAHRYNWEVRVDPTAATTKEMQQLLMIIRRFVERERCSVTDEFDNEDATGPDPVSSDELGPHPNFGDIARLARLQELLDTLRAGGVGVLAGHYFHMSLTSMEEKRAGWRILLPKTDVKSKGVLELTSMRILISKTDEIDELQKGEGVVEIEEVQKREGVLTKIEGVLEIQFVPGDVDEDVICIDTGICIPTRILEQLPLR
jgi:transcriptional regulator with XRE-family HTH domain